MKEMPAWRVNLENNVSSNASWQRGYITLVNLKLTSEGGEETTDSLWRPTSSKQRGRAYIQSWKLICHLAGIHPNYFKGTIKGTFSIGYCRPNNSLSSICTIKNNHIRADRFQGFPTTVAQDESPRQQRNGAPMLNQTKGRLLTLHYSTASDKNE